MIKNISAVVLTYNEELNIKSCLESLEWVEDVLVLDSGSSDKTRKICKKIGVRFIEHKQKSFNAALQRNWALDHGDIQGEWVLFMDADEIVTEDLRQELMAAIEKAGHEIVGFRLAPKFMFLGKWLKRTMAYPSWHDRVVRKGAIRYKSIYPYEVFEKTEGIIGKIKEPYMHYAFNNGMHRWFEKHNRYSSLYARQLVFGELPSSRNSRAKLLRMASKHLFVGPVLRMGYHLIYKMGILDGFSGIVYSMLMGTYQFMICIKVKELKQKDHKRSRGIMESISKNSIKSHTS